MKGFTLIEVMVALVALSIGSGSVWYGLQASAKQDRNGRLHIMALEAARSQLESVQNRPRQSIHDTSFQLLIGETPVLQVNRVVLDSARLLELLPEIVLDEQGSPLALHKPLEVKVEVWELQNDSLSGESQKKRSLLTLSTLIPDYAWY